MGTIVRAGAPPAGRHLPAARLGGLSPAVVQRSAVGRSLAGLGRRAALPGVRADRLVAAGRADRARGADPPAGRRRGRRRHRGLVRPAAAAGRQPAGRRNVLAGAGAAGGRGHAAAGCAVRAGRRAGVRGRHRVPCPQRGGARAGRTRPRPCRVCAEPDGRPAVGDRRSGLRRAAAGRRRTDHDLCRRRRGVRSRRDRSGAAAGADTARRRVGAGSAGGDRRPPLRSQPAGAALDLRHRPERDDLRDAPRAVPGACQEHVSGRPGRPRAALRRARRRCADRRASAAAG